MTELLLPDDHYRRNAFRVTGLAVTATPRAIRRRRREWELGALSAEALGPLAPESTPTPTELSSAFARLEDPRTRIVDELTWFWAGEGESASPYVSVHDRAVRHHCRALDLEARSGPLTEAERRERDAAWETAMAAWAEVTDEPEVWRHLRARVQEIGDERLPAGRVTVMRNHLAGALLDQGAALALAQARRGEDVGRHRHQLAVLTGGDTDRVDAALRSAASALVAQVDTATETARANVDDVSAAQVLLADTAAARAVLARILPSSDRVVRRLGDTVATTVRQIAAAHANATIKASEPAHPGAPDTASRRLRAMIPVSRTLLNAARDLATETTLLASIDKDLATLATLEKEITPPSRPATPRPATPRPATPRPATPRPATPRPATPRPAAPRPAAPRPTGTPPPTRRPPASAPRSSRVGEASVKVWAVVVSALAGAGGLAAAVFQLRPLTLVLGVLCVVFALVGCDNTPMLRRGLVLSILTFVVILVGGQVIASTGVGP